MLMFSLRKDFMIYVVDQTQEYVDYLKKKGWSSDKLIFLPKKKDMSNLGATRRYQERQKLGLKFCRKCQTAKPKSEFYKDKQKKDCLHSRCKECDKKENNK